MNILVFFIILLILVLIHEFGHFIAAKKSGVKVEEFGFGFPPRLFGIRFGETLYSINLIPLGGFVKVYGEEYKELAKTKVDDALRSRAFAYKKPWQKGLIIIAGVVMNFILGWVLFSFLLTQGVPTPAGKVIVEQVQQNSPASQAGLQPQDILVAIKKNGREFPLKTAQDLIGLSKKFGDQKIVIVVEKEGKSRQVSITPRKSPPAGQGPLGISITSFVEKKYPWYQAPFYGLIEAFNITKHIVIELGKVVSQLITLKKPDVEVTGPVGIAQFTGHAMKFGKNAVLELIALLSLNLAVINILPFPALDGGRLVFVFYEWFTKKRVNEKLENMLNLIGFAILITMAIVITVNDIMKLYR